MKLQWTIGPCSTPKHRVDDVGKHSQAAVSQITPTRLVLISAMLALLTLLVGGLMSYQTRDFTWETFQISSIQSAYTNPTGYLISAIGTLVSQSLLIVMTIQLVRHFRDIYAGVFLIVALVLLNVNSIHDIIDMKNWMIHAVLAHVGFGLMILAHIMFVVQAKLWQAERELKLRRRFYLDLRWAVFSLIVVMVFFIIPKFTGIDIPARLFNIDVDYMLGACEVIYLVVFYVSMYHVAALMLDDLSTR